MTRGSAAEALDPVQRQIACRAINEEISGISHAVSGGRDIDLLCECERRGCLETVRVSPRIYEDVRRFPTRFLVKAGHVEPENDRAVVQADRLVVVEKIRPDDAEAAIRSDPRRVHPAAQLIDQGGP